MVDFSPSIRRHRQRLAELDSGVLAAFAAAPTVRNNDVTRVFRRGSELYSNTGFGEPGAARTLVAGEAASSVPFARCEWVDVERACRV
jgi:hypothetical protein